MRLKVVNRTLFVLCMGIVVAVVSTCPLGQFQKCIISVEGKEYFSALAERTCRA
jgi:hypothetical protein